MRKKLSTIALFVVLTLGLVGIIAPPVQAASGPVVQFAACSTNGGFYDFFGFPPWHACLPKTNGEIRITKLEDLWLIALPLLETAIKAAAYVAVALIIWGGIKYVKSQGNPSEIAGARDTIRDAVIGLIICMLSVAIVQFVASRL